MSHTNETRTTENENMYNDVLRWCKRFWFGEATASLDLAASEFSAYTLQLATFTKKRGKAERLGAVVIDSVADDEVKNVTCVLVSGKKRIKSGFLIAPKRQKSDVVTACQTVREDTLSNKTADSTMVTRPPSEQSQYLDKLMIGLIFLMVLTGVVPIAVAVVYLVKEGCPSCRGHQTTKDGDQGTCVYSEISDSVIDPASQPASSISRWLIPNGDNSNTTADVHVRDPGAQGSNRQVNPPEASDPTSVEGDIHTYWVIPDHYFNVNDPGCRRNSLPTEDPHDYWQIPDKYYTDYQNVDGQANRRPSSLPLVHDVMYENAGRYPRCRRNSMPTDDPEYCQIPGKYYTAYQNVAGQTNRRPSSLPLAHDVMYENAGRYQNTGRLHRQLSAPDDNDAATFDTAEAEVALPEVTRKGAKNPHYGNPVRFTKSLNYGRRAGELRKKADAIAYGRTVSRSTAGVLKTYDFTKSLSYGRRAGELRKKADAIAYGRTVSRSTAGVLKTYDFTKSLSYGRRAGELRKKADAIAYGRTVSRSTAGVLKTYDFTKSLSYGRRAGELRKKADAIAYGRTVSRSTAGVLKTYDFTKSLSYGRRAGELRKKADAIAYGRTVSRSTAGVLKTCDFTKSLNYGRRAGELRKKGDGIAYGRTVSRSTAGVLKTYDFTKSLSYGRRAGELRKKGDGIAYGRTVSRSTAGVLKTCDFTKSLNYGRRAGELRKKADAIAYGRTVSRSTAGVLKTCDFTKSLNYGRRAGELRKKGDGIAYGRTVSRSTAGVLKTYDFTKSLSYGRRAGELRKKGDGIAYGRTVSRSTAGVLKTYDFTKSLSYGRRAGELRKKADAIAYGRTVSRSTAGVLKTYDFTKSLNYGRRAGELRKKGDGIAYGRTVSLRSTAEVLKTYEECGTVPALQVLEPIARNPPTDELKKVVSARITPGHRHSV
ncbi:Hypp558 [Branchiostoma lanceolatum]|uniref:Hypp558 protein n=1 Tax=Branchiostoma lanceolatum TaxID=7740 RepID=A0A8J9YP90_BRALA|nr:Hypp558 [Branchiostoma lanceolatum]